MPRLCRQLWGWTATSPLHMAALELPTLAAAAAAPTEDPPSGCCCPTPTCIWYGILHIYEGTWNGIEN